jgi:basic amino acid/polyamine antiporter, APA family
MPRSSLLGILACGAIFVLVNAALVHIFPVDTLAASRVPVADAAALLFGPPGRIAVLLLAILTVISCINAVLLMTPRILFALGREGLMPAWVTTVNRGGTPSGALFLTAAVSVALVVSGSFDALVAMTAILYVAVYLSGFLSLFVLRMKEPSLPRPFKMWGYPWTTFGITLGCGAFLIAAIVADLKHALFTLVVIAGTYPLYKAIKAVRRWRGDVSPEMRLVTGAEDE